MPKGRVVGDNDMVPEPEIPVPLNATVCGEVGGVKVASSVNTRPAMRLLRAVGVNVTLMTQLPPAITCAPQLLVWEKSPEAVPVMAIEVKFNGPVPVLVRVTGRGLEGTFCAWGEKFRLWTERLTTGAVPFPVSETAANGVAASLPMVRVAVWLPVAVGLNVTLTVQALEAGTIVPQLLDATNSLAPRPLRVTEVMLTGKALLLVRVTVSGRLLSPTLALPRLSDVGLTAAAAPPVPVSGTKSGVDEPLVETVRVPVRVPEAVGVKATAMTQLAVAASDVPQLPVCATTWKSPVVTGALNESV